MKHYRVLTNGDKFRVQTWDCFWPFWMYVKRYYGHTFTAVEISEWETREAAEQWIAEERAKDTYFKKHWKPL